MGKKYDRTNDYQTIKDASRTTGLSQYFLRKGCKNGTIPHTMCGCKYMIIMPKLMESLSQQSSAGK